MSQSLTKHRDLRSGRPLWMALPCPAVDTQTLTRKQKCDVLVIGAGISGALITQALIDEGLNVIVVDRRLPLSGSTAASTAMLQYEIDTPLHQLAGRIGQERAERIWRRSRLAVNSLRDRTRRLGLRCDDASRDTLYLDGNVLDSAGLDQEFESRRRCGFEVERLKPAALAERFGIAGRNAILSFDNYSANPRKLAAGYLQTAINGGARFYNPVDVCDITASENGVLVETRDGPEISATTVIFATGYEQVKGVPRLGNKIISSWTIATRPQKRNLWPGEAIIWEAADPYLYIRTTPQGHVICGGEDAEIADADERDALNHAKTNRLSEKLGKLFPQLDPTAAYAWSGSFGNSPTGTPTIGRVPRMPNCYAAMGYGGNGITFSMMAAQILSGQITGRGDPDADLFSFTRDF